MTTLTFLVGIGAIAVSIYLFVDTWDLVKHSQFCPGTVLRIERTKGSRGRWVYRTVGEFRTGKRKRVEFKDGFFATTVRPPYEVGQMVRVRYHAHNPCKAAIDTGIFLWTPAFASLGFGLFFLYGFVACVIGATKCR